MESLSEEELWEALERLYNPERLEKIDPESLWARTEALHVQMRRENAERVQRGECAMKILEENAPLKITASKTHARKLQPASWA